NRQGFENADLDNAGGLGVGAGRLKVEDGERLVQDQVLEHELYELPPMLRGLTVSGRLVGWQLPARANGHLRSLSPALLTEDGSPKNAGRMGSPWIIRRISSQSARYSRDVVSWKDQ